MKKVLSSSKRFIVFLNNNLLASLFFVSGLALTFLIIFVSFYQIEDYHKVFNFVLAISGIYLLVSYLTLNFLMEKEYQKYQKK